MSTFKGQLGVYQNDQWVAYRRVGGNSRQRRRLKRQLEAQGYTVARWCKSHLSPGRWV